jgi:hypothetical protein
MWRKFGGCFILSFTIFIFLSSTSTPSQEMPILADWISPIKAFECYLVRFATWVYSSHLDILLVKSLTGQDHGGLCLTWNPSAMRGWVQDWVHPKISKRHLERAWAWPNRGDAPWPETSIELTFSVLGGSRKLSAWESRVPNDFMIEKKHQCLVSNSSNGNTKLPVFSCEKIFHGATPPNVYYWPKDE